MSFIKKSTSALGKLIMVVLLAAAFLAGMVSVVMLSLQGEEIKVPEIVGKNFAETEKELAALGLRIKKRADRYSEEPPNTVLEQLPKSGDTVKTGQMILVVTSKASSDGTEAPMKIQKNTDTTEEDSEKIQELIDDKTKKTTNSNKTVTTNKKKATTTRDVVSNTSTKSNTSSGNSNSGGGDSGNNNSSNSNKSTTTPTNKSNPTTTPKPQIPKQGGDGGSTRPRTTNP